MRMCVYIYMYVYMYICLCRVEQIFKALHHLRTILCWSAFLLKLPQQPSSPNSVTTRQVEPHQPASPKKKRNKTQQPRPAMPQRWRLRGGELHTPRVNVSKHMCNNITMMQRDYTPRYTCMVVVRTHHMNLLISSMRSLDRRSLSFVT